MVIPVAVGECVTIGMRQFGELPEEGNPAWGDIPRRWWWDAIKEAVGGAVCTCGGTFRTGTALKLNRRGELCPFYALMCPSCCALIPIDAVFYSSELPRSASVHLGDSRGTICGRISAKRVYPCPKIFRSKTAKAWER